MHGDRCVSQELCANNSITSFGSALFTLSGGTNSTNNQVHIYGSFVPLDANPEDLYIVQ